jgi:hypothetical protein
MPNSQNYVSPEQFAANRANAAKSSGPRSPEGKTRSAQNARKHGFTSAAYTVVRLEDVQEVANLKDDAVEFYQPVNSQEFFAVERIALTQQAMLRAARLEAGLFTSCLNEACGLTDIPRVQIDPILLADIEVARVQNRNFVLAEGFQHSAAKSNALSLCLRYAAQAERHYRRAVDEFDRLKAIRPAPGGADLPVCVLPEPLLGETNPIPSEPPQNEALAVPPSPQPEPIPATPDVPESIHWEDHWEPCHPSGAPASPDASSPLGTVGSGLPVDRRLPSRNPFPPPACEN